MAEACRLIGCWKHLSFLFLMIYFINMNQIKTDEVFKIQANLNHLKRNIITLSFGLNITSNIQ